MDYIKTNYIDAYYSNFHQKELASGHQFAEVVLVDNSHQALKTLLYQLNKEAIQNNDLIGMPKDLIIEHGDAFTLIGEIDLIDKKNKLIYLSNKKTVAYNYLILANSTEQICITKQDDGFFNGLQNLVHALRVRKIYTCLPKNQPSHSSAKNSRFMSFDISTMCLPDDIQNIILQKKAHKKKRMNATRRYLYEVVI